MLDVEGISKTYGELRANDRVSLSVGDGEIHALLGENGAGKSTLVKMLYGAMQPDEGRILWQGEPVHIANPAAARRLGIGMVFQHFSLFESLTVAENISLALPPGRSGRQLDAEVSEISQRYGLPLHPEKIIADLSAGERQRVEIVRCLLQDPKLIILDEPTSVLTPQEADALFVSLERLASEGRSILYISHKLDEVRRLCQVATILRHGKVVATCDPSEMTPAEIARAMVGDHVADVRSGAAPVAPEGPAALAVSDLSLPAPTPHATALRGVSFDVHAGEVRAIAGVAGNGQGELFEALSGERRALTPTAVSLFGEPVGRRGVNGRRKRGAAFVSEERLGHGAAPDRRLSENVVLTRARLEPELMRWSLINFSAARAIKDRVREAFDVRAASDDPLARELSGGNLQKFIVGREVDRSPKVLIVDQPTWGVDAGAAARIRQTLIDLARDGAAVLVISQDLDEIFEIADRIAVLNEGRLSAFVPAAEATREAVGLLMTGSTQEGADAA